MHAHRNKQHLPSYFLTMERVSLVPLCADDTLISAGTPNLAQADEILLPQSLSLAEPIIITALHLGAGNSNCNI